MATILDGKALSEIILREAKDTIEQNHLSPCLVVITVGDDAASKVYVRNKKRACEKVGILFTHVKLPEDTTQEKLEKEVRRYSCYTDVSGVMIQLPVPEHLDICQAMELIPPEKDVDGFTNASKLHLDNDMPLKDELKRHLPCTPDGIWELLSRNKIFMPGKNVVVVGRSEIVGKPMAKIALANDATVTVCHSWTRDLPSMTRAADILISAAGQANLITSDMVKDGAVVIDVGMNRVNGKLVGDVDFEHVKEKASYITPVPGGVGPMTVAKLVEHTVRACEILQKK